MSRLCCRLLNTSTVVLGFIYLFLLRLDDMAIQVPVSELLLWKRYPIKNERVNMNMPFELQPELPSELPPLRKMSPTL